MPRAVSTVSETYGHAAGCGFRNFMHLSLTKLFIGRPVANREAEAHKLGPLAGVPAMGLDGLSSTAYGPEATLTVLAVDGMAGLDVHDQERQLLLDPRTTVLDALREHIGLTGTKKGCDQGQCGACTVLIDGRNVLSCPTLAVSSEGRRITTIGRLAVCSPVCAPERKAASPVSAGSRGMMRSTCIRRHASDL